MVPLSRDEIKDYFYNTKIVIKFCLFLTSIKKCEILTYNILIHKFFRLLLSKFSGSNKINRSIIKVFKFYPLLT